MIRSWKIGDATVVSIVEYFGPTHQPEAVFPEFDRAAFARRADVANVLPGVDGSALDLVVDYLTYVVVPAVFMVRFGLLPDGFALALAGCDTVSRATATRQFAVVEADKTGATEVNIASLTDVIQRNPSDAAAYNTRGAAYARAGNFDSAIADFTKAIQLDPNSASAYGNRALAFRQSGRSDAALQFPTPK